VKYLLRVLALVAGLAVVAVLYSFLVEQEDRQLIVVADSNQVSKSSPTSEVNKSGSNSGRALGAVVAADSKGQLRLIAELKVSLREALLDSLSGGIAGTRLEQLFDYILEAPISRAEKQSLLLDIVLEQSNQAQRDIVYDILERVGSETVIPRVLEHLNGASIDDRARLVVFLDRSLQVSDVSDPAIRSALERNTILIGDALDKLIRNSLPSDPSFKLAIEAIPGIVPQDQVRDLYDGLLAQGRLSKSDYNVGIVRIYASETATFEQIAAIVLPILAGDPPEARTLANQTLFEYVRANTDSPALQNVQLREYLESQRPANHARDDADQAQWVHQYSNWITAVASVNHTSADPLSLAIFNSVDRAVAIAGNAVVLDKYNARQLSELSTQLREAAIRTPRGSLAQPVIETAITIVASRQQGKR